MLQDEKPDLAEVDEALKDVIDAAMRVAEITQRERKLLRKSELSIAPVDVNEIIREVELFIRAEARQDGGTLTLELTPGLPMIMADGIQLQQVILNLARNAFQAMLDQPRETRKVCIGTMAQSGEVILTVADSGPPIDETCLKQMFQPFYTTKSNGLGMGLSISKSIIETHRGRISAIRNPERGLTMQIALPRIEADNVSHRRDSPGR
jgi:C4-dicarboxylate-specific signal transduction histidine kinase